MSWLTKLAAALCLGVSLWPMTTAGRDAHRDVIPVMTRYFDLISAGNFDIAGDMWSPEALERSGRFGIKYTGIALKVDCNSPIIRNLDELDSRPVSPIRKYETLMENDWYKLEYSNLQGNSLMRHYYYAQRRGDWFWLSYPQDFYAADWPVTESRYFRVHTHPEVQKYLNDVVLDEADQFVETMAARLSMPGSSLERIAEDKIEYFYCPSDSVVEQITGFLVKGTLDLASNDIVSADFPHFHETSHLLINIRLQEMPLYTLPVIREGLAVNLAGRWGKHPAVLMDLAVAIYGLELVTFDSIFTLHGFKTESGAEIVYSVAGIFCDYLIDRLGEETVLDLYLQLSGKYDYVNGLTAEDVQRIMISATGHADWNALIADFDAYIQDYSERRLVAIPGSGNQGKTLLNEERFIVREDGNWVAFDFRGDPSDSVLEGNLVFAPDDGLVGQFSLMFESQYGSSQPFEGYRYGVRFDRNEIGLYDYATNRLVGKYIWGITPSEEYYDAERNIIGVRFNKSLFKGRLPQPGQCRLLPL